MGDGKGSAVVGNKLDALKEKMTYNSNRLLRAACLP
jgi:hypothetical protein